MTNCDTNTQGDIVGAAKRSSGWGGGKKLRNYIYATPDLKFEIRDTPKHKL